LIFDGISQPTTSPKSNPAKQHHFTYTTLGELTSTMGTGYSASSGKAPLNNGSVGALHESNMHSQTPYRAVLQPSYAKVWKADQEDAKSHGWYAAMIEGLGTSIGTCGAIPCCV